MKSFFSFPEHDTVDTFGGKSIGERGKCDDVFKGMIFHSSFFQFI